MNVRYKDQGDKVMVHGYQGYYHAGGKLESLHCFVALRDRKEA